MSLVTSLVATGLSATTPYILVDKSNTAEYPHNTAGPISVKSLRVQGEQIGAGAWIVRVGVLEEADATDGTTQWFYEASTAAAARFSDVLSWDGGLQCDENGLGFIGTRNATNTNFQTDTAIANPTAGTDAPAAGDIVVEVVESSGTTTYDISIQIEYEIQR